MKAKTRQTDWWRFAGDGTTGEFAAEGVEHIGRLYFPLANEAGMRSWVTPALQGSPAASHNEYLGVPLTAEDFPNTLIHRGFWVVEEGRKPFSLSFLPPGGSRLAAPKPAVAGEGGSPATVKAGPGWFSLSRSERGGRFRVLATLWCPADLDEKIEIMLVEVTNTSRRKLAFAPYAAIPLFARSADNVRDHRHVTALLHRVQVTRHGVTVCPTMSFDERGHKANRVRYSALGFGPRGAAPASIWPTQESFLGEGGSFAAPAAVWRRENAPVLTPVQLRGRETLGGFRFADTVLPPGKSARFVLVSGISEDPGAVARWTRWARKPGVVAKSLAATQAYWQEKAHRVSFGTPDSRLNNWLTWVNCQPTFRRLYGNSYLPQFDYGRGGRGWRDLWQDGLALLLAEPESVKPMLLHNFGGVRIDGSNATIIGRRGEFVADRNNIPRTWMDHGVWPTYTTLLYIDQTGDLGFLLKEREYFRDPQLYRCRRRDEKWTESYGFNLRAQGGAAYRGTILEHMLVQNLTAFFNVGEHNLCRLEGADWNDGLDMAADRGESVAFSAFYAWNLERLALAVEQLALRGTPIYLARELVMLLDRLPGSRPVNYRSAGAKQERLHTYLNVVARDVSGRKMAVWIEDLARDLRAKARDLSGRISRQEWLKAGGLSFFNGYYDNHGRRVEGRHAGGVRMTLTGQVFPVMAGIASDDQVSGVVRSVRRLLKDPVTGGTRLNTDFGGMQPALGRAFSFAYGEKENGAVFSHMAVMYAYALYLRRRPEAGREVWSALYRAAADSGVAKVLPGLPEYFNAEGRGMYCYLTGSASWLVYLLLTQAYGLRGELGDLVIDPQLMPEDFDTEGRCSVRLHFAGRPLAVTFVNGRRLRPGRYAVGGVTCNDKEVSFKARPQGGILLRRRFIEALAAGRTTPLTVFLATGRPDTASAELAKRDT